MESRRVLTICTILLFTSIPSVVAQTVLPNLRIHPTTNSQTEIHMDALRNGGQDSIWVFAVGVVWDNDSDLIEYHFRKMAVPNSA